ncbi:MAG: pilus assembly protein PilP [Acidobacteria bacterium]|nr:pilus assembly protein PilP [Acidobacteriota bacterium]
MRLLKPIWLVVLAGAVSLGAAGLAAQAKQPPPAKTPPAKKTTTPAAPAMGTTAPAPQSKAPAAVTKTPATKAPATKAHAAPSKSAPAKQGKAPAATKPGAAAAAPAAADAAKAASSELQPGNRRDPFASLISGGKQGPDTEMSCRAPGKGGIVIDTMRVDGIVRSSSAVLAVVRTPQSRVYFLHDGDRLCDGRVEKISMDGVTLRQTSRDAFGKPIERMVSKRLFPSAGE